MAAFAIWSLVLPLLVATVFGNEINPFSPKASVQRYWSQRVAGPAKIPAFLLDKASPLDALNSALLRRYVEQNTLPTHLRSFCDAARLFCLPNPAASLEKHSDNVNFAAYSGQNFSNYRSDAVGGADSFMNYSQNENVVADTFTRYSRSSVGHGDTFTAYLPNVNVGDGEFSSYGIGASGGGGQFAHYADNINVPNLQFKTYESDGVGRSREFKTYSDQANAGDQSFRSYGRRGTGVPTTFSSYGESSNVIGSTFINYGESGTRANDSFNSYGHNGNVPEDNFRSYGEGGNGAVDSFASYRDDANVGDDSFTSYGKHGVSPKVGFANYGQSANVGSDRFKGYGQGATGAQIGFKIYGVNNSFGDYADKKSVSFASYTTPTSGTPAKTTTNKWAVEPGKFFREKMLKTGTVMPMPDIRDRMPPRSFLPRSVSEKLPFSSSKLGELKQLFEAGDDSAMAKTIQKTLAECERKPTKGESKRCVTSIEDMIDFATSMLGKKVDLRSTDSTAGSGKNVEIGEVKGLDGGRITRTVSCHQSLFPYMVYYCHSVPVVRAYEADILDVDSKKKINHGVAVCHLDTSAWGPSHGAFLSLGSKPGEIEVCHWIFENDMVWVRSS
ncbi:Polygalacturonase 1 beta-like protein 3 [Nymphaea thermarum]|nr:Polygalacturonase 1 beta-like protein 3 [Nymphaea thermarum]